MIRLITTVPVRASDWVRGLPKAASLDRRCSSAAFELIEETLGPVDIPFLDGDVERI